MYCIWDRCTGKLLKSVFADLLVTKFEFVRVEEAKNALTYSDEKDAVRFVNMLYMLIPLDYDFEVVKVEEKTQFVITKFE